VLKKIKQLVALERMASQQGAQLFAHVRFRKEFAKDIGELIKPVFGAGARSGEQRRQADSYTARDRLFLFGASDGIAQLAANAFEDLGS
jgi:hypothetical protein